MTNKHITDTLWIPNYSKLSELTDLLHIPSIALAHI